MTHFLLRLALFDFAYMAIHLKHTFNGRFEEAMVAFALAWIFDPIAKYAAPYVYIGWMRLYNCCRK